MNANKFLSPKNDLAFKRVFGTERNKDILIHFLNDILMRDKLIQKLSFLKTSQDPEIAPLRVSIVDVLCEDENKDKFVIEMQLSHEKSFERRALYYAARAYCSQRKKEILYQDLRDVYFLAITDFAPFPYKKHWLSRLGVKDIDTHEHDIRALQLFFLQMPLFKKKKEDLPTMTLPEKWVYYLKYAEQTVENDLEGIIGKDQILGRAYEELNRYAWSEEELNDYESIEMKQAADRAVQEAARDKGREEGEKIGIAKGEQIGIVKANRELARRLLQKGVMSLDEVVEVTGLSLDEVKGIEGELR